MRELRYIFYLFLKVLCASFIILSLCSTIILVSYSINKSKLKTEYYTIVATDSNYVYLDEEVVPNKIDYDILSDEDLESNSVKVIELKDGEFIPYEALDDFMNTLARYTLLMNAFVIVFCACILLLL